MQYRQTNKKDEDICSYTKLSYQLQNEKSQLQNDLYLPPSAWFGLFTTLIFSLWKISL